jgi:hypothetical protein
MTVFLYDIKRRIDMTLRESGGSINWNLPMHNPDFRIFKDVQNKIEFVVRNTDRKPINMLGRSAAINLFDYRTRKLLYTGDLDVLNDAKGLLSMKLSADVTEDWPTGYLAYTITVTNLDGSVQVLYVDQSEEHRGFLELALGPRPEPRPSIEVVDFITNSQPDEFDVIQHYQFTYAMPGSLKTGNNEGLHNLAVYTDRFTGKLWVEGSIEEGVPTEQDWFNIPVNELEYQEYNDETGMKAYTFVANLNYVRIKIHNEQVLPFDSSEDDIGKVTKLVFRN